MIENMKKSEKLSETIMKVVIDFFDKNEKEKMEASDIILAVHISMATILTCVTEMIVKKDAPKSVKVSFIEGIANMATDKYKKKDKMN